MLSQISALDTNWRDTVRQHERTVVCCWANWNPVDTQFAAVLQRVLPNYDERFAVFTADIDNRELWPFLHLIGVMTVPTLALLRRDVGVELMMGFVSEDALRERLDAWLQE